MTFARVSESNGVPDGDSEDPKDDRDRVITRKQIRVTAAPREADP